MGYLGAFFRTMYLQDYTHNIQCKITDITSQKLNLTDTVSKIIQEISDLDAESPTVKQLQAQKAELEAMEKRLDAQLAKYNAQLQAAQQEQQSAQAMMQKSIEQSFSYGR